MHDLWLHVATLSRLLAPDDLGQARAVFLLRRLVHALGQQVGDLMHENSGSPKCRGATLNGAGLDDELHGAAITGKAMILA